MQKRFSKTLLIFFALALSFIATFLSANRAEAISRRDLMHGLTPILRARSNGFPKKAKQRVMTLCPSGEIHVFLLVQDNGKWVAGGLGKHHKFFLPHCKAQTLSLVAPGHSSFGSIDAATGMYDLSVGTNVLSNVFQFP